MIAIKIQRRYGPSDYSGSPSLSAVVQCYSCPDYFRPISLPWPTEALYEQQDRWPYGKPQILSLEIVGCKRRQAKHHDIFSDEERLQQSIGELLSA